MLSPTAHVSRGSTRSAAEQRFEHAPVRLAATELALDHDVLEVTASPKALDLGSLGGSAAVRHQPQPYAARPQPVERLDRTFEDCRALVSQGAVERRDVGHDIGVDTALPPHNVAEDLKRRRLQVQASPLRALAVGPPPVRVDGDRLLQRRRVQAGHTPRRLRASVGPARLDATAVVEDRVVEVDQDAGGQIVHAAMIAYGRVVCPRQPRMQMST